MKLRSVLTGLALCALGSALAAPSYAQMKEFAGTWILSHSKSTGPLPTYEDVIVKINGDTEEYANHITDNGKKQLGEYQAKVDGKEYPEKHEDGSVTYIALTDLFPRTEEAKIYTHDASGASTLVARFFRVVSPDGKTLYDTLCKADGSLTGFRVFEKSSGMKKAAAKAQ